MQRARQAQRARERERRVLVIFGLPSEVDEEEIHALCFANGSNNPAVARHPMTLSSLGFAFVTWQSAWDAAQAAEKLNRHHIRPGVAITCKIYVADAMRSRSDEPLMRDLSAKCWAPSAQTLATPSDVGKLHQSAALLASRPRDRTQSAHISRQASARDAMEADALLRFFVASLASLRLDRLGDDAVRAALLDHGVGSADDRDRVLDAVRASEDSGAEAALPATAESAAAAAERAAAHSAFLPSWLDLCFGRRGANGLPMPPALPLEPAALTLLSSSASPLVRRSSSQLSRQTSAASMDLQSVSFILCTVTFYSNRAHNLTRSP